MSKFENYLKKFDITSTLTDEDIENTLALLQIYSPTVRRTADRIEEIDEECYEGRRQSISDFINLAIDFDHDADRKRIADRLAEMGHSMQLLSIMEEALVLVKGSRPHGVMYYKILHARYFDALENSFYYLAPRADWNAQAKSILAPGVKQISVLTPEELQASIEELKVKVE